MTYKVIPSDFAKWAIENVTPVPDELRALAGDLSLHGGNTPPYLDTTNENYAPELAIAVKAWERSLL